jgi:sortase A
MSDFLASNNQPFLAPTDFSYHRAGAKESANSMCADLLPTGPNSATEDDRRAAFQSRQDIVTFQRGERVLLGLGLALLAVWFGARVYGAFNSKKAIARFQAAHADNVIGGISTSSDQFVGSPVDFSLWSPKRIAAYEDSLAKKNDFPLAILRIRKINLEVPVYNNTDDLTLNRGVGRILGTAYVGESGNLGIAGHRDGFFRGLQNIAEGDVVEFVRPGQTNKYVVSDIRIVTPEDTSVLKPKEVPALTLVTCFPFYFVGHAPKRYIVTALLEGARQFSFGADEGTISSGENTKK